MPPDLFEELVNLIVAHNGNGHKQLKALVETGKVSEEHAALISLKASAKRLEKRVNVWEQNLACY